MTEELKELGIDVGHRRVGRLMRQNGLMVVRTRKYKATTDSNHRFNIAPNRRNQNFIAERPNQKWAGDISYIWTREGWSYLSVVLDLHSRRVIGWATGNRLKVDLAMRALDNAIALDVLPRNVLDFKLVCSYKETDNETIKIQPRANHWDLKRTSSRDECSRTLP